MINRFIVNFMTLLTQRDFARKCGVSPQAISKAIKEGRVIKDEKKINPNNPQNAAYIKLIQMRKDENGGTLDRSKSRNKKKKNDASEPEPESKPELNDQDLENLAKGQLSIPLDSLSKTSADRLKTLEQVRKIQIESDTKRKNLLPREEIKRIFARLYMIETNELKTISDAVAPEIAAIYEDDNLDHQFKTKKIIDAKVYRALKHIQRLWSDYLEKNGAGQLAVDN